MKKAMQFAAATAFAALQWCASAATIEVETVAELTNAVARANAGETIGGEAIDTIRLKKGTYTFTDQAMSANGLISVGNVPLAIEGEDDSSRKTWTDGSEPVIIDGNNLGRILYFANSTRTKVVRNICFIRAKCADGGAMRSLSVGVATATNCVFRQNSANGGDAAVSMWVALRDCLVKESSGGTTVRGGDASQTLRAYGCDFVRNANGIATYSFAAQDCTFVCNTNSGHGVIGESSNIFATNCTFTGNYGAFISTGNSFCNCVFSNNVCNGNVGNNNENKGGILCDPRDVRGCDFIDNYGEKDCCAIYHLGDTAMTVADSTFLRNVTAGSYGAGAAIRMRPNTASCTMTVTNCTFEGNVVTSSSGNSAAIYNHSNASGIEMYRQATVMDSKFTTNSAYSVCGVRGIKAVRCTFDRNRRSSHTSGACDAARNSYLVECDFNDADFEKCILDRCKIHDVSGGAQSMFGGYTRVTNTIIANCCLSEQASLYAYTSSYDTAMDAEFVNCTIVSNQLRTYAPNAKFLPTVGIAFKNCLFYGNNTGYGDNDISANDSSASQSALITFQNSYAGKIGLFNFTADEMYAFTNAPNTLAVCADPKFVQDSRPDAPYWSLSLKSPLLGKGDLLDFTDSDFDLAGRPRLKDGYIDPGCYQCWIRSLGLMMIIR